MRKLLIMVAILCVKISFSQTTYIFNGNGNWSISSNWINNLIPPIILDSGSHIIIDPIINGECILDTLQFFKRGSDITVETNKKFNLGEKILTGLEERGLGCSYSNYDSLLLVPVLDTSSLPRLNKKMPSALSLPLIDSDLPEVVSQRNQGSCTAFAVAYAARSFYLHRDHCTSYFKNGVKDLSKVLSPSFSYNLGKIAPSCNADFPLLNALNNLMNIGVCTWERMPYYDFDCSTLPTISELDNARVYKINSFARVKNCSKENIKRILNSGNVIVAGVAVDYGFYEYGGNIWKSNIGGILPNGGGHAIVICGYDDAKNAFEVMNSWGKNWGLNGFGWIDYGYLQEVLRLSPQAVSYRNGEEGDWEMFVMKTSPKFGVDFKTDPVTIKAGSTFKLINLTEPEPSRIEWSFPNGNPSTSTSLSPSVSYENAGEYDIKLSVFTCNGYSEVKTSRITVVETGSSLTISNPSNYPNPQPIPGDLNNTCGGYVICDFTCDAENWDVNLNAPIFKDSEGNTKVVNGVLLENITNNWGFPSTSCTNSTDGRALIFYNVTIIDGIATGNVKVLGDFGTCNPDPPYSEQYFTSFKFTLINSTLNSDTQTSYNGTYSIASNSLSTHQ